MDGRPRTLAEFRAIRETVGMTQGMLAEELGVNPRSVRRWESPDYDGYRPPQDAWDVLDEALDTQRRGIAAALGRLDEIVKERESAPDSVQLPYWTSQSDYDRHHYIDDGGDWRMANATNRMLASALHERGIEVDWTDGPTVPRMEDDGEDTEMKLTKTADNMYVDEDGIEYDLSEIEDLGDGFGSRLLHLYARKDGHEACIITNHEGEGRWVSFTGPSGIEYRQVAGTMQYRLPDTDKAICAQLRRDLLSMM